MPRIFTSFLLYTHLSKTTPPYTMLANKHEAYYFNRINSMLYIRLARLVNDLAATPNPAINHSDHVGVPPRASSFPHSNTPSSCHSHLAENF